MNKIVISENMNRQQLAQKIMEVAHLRGKFKLRSGQISDEYFDKYRFEAHPKILKEIAQQMAPLIPPHIDALAGLEMGGIPVATALSLETGLPCLFVRKAAKDYGTCQLAEGLDIKGKKLCLIEDVITTGGQVALSTKDLRDLGATIEHVLCVIHRGQSSESKLSETGLHLKPLFNMSELKASQLS